MPKAAINQPLPPPGAERREVLKEREDVLQEAAETLAAQREVETINPKVLEVESELAQHFDELEVIGADPDYAYCWVLTGFGGRHVQRKLFQGWEVVQGNDPAAAALRHVDTTRRLGDVILMKIHKDRKHLLDMREDHKKRMQEGAVTGTLEDLQEKYARLGIKVHTPGYISEELMSRMANTASARQLAGRQMDTWLRQGRVPGMTITE